MLLPEADAGELTASAMSLADLIVQFAPQAFPRWYRRVAAAVLAPAHRTLAEEAAARFGDQCVLDFGTGTGSVPILLAQRAAHVKLDAVDVSDHMLMAAEDAAREAGVRDRIRFGLLKSPLVPRPAGWDECLYDLVICCMVAHEAAQRAAALLGMFHRMLRPGGECWWVEARAEHTWSERTTVQHLRRRKALPRWLPRAAAEASLSRFKERLLTGPERDEAVRLSPFGIAHEQRALAVDLGKMPGEGALAWTLLRAPDLIARSES